jgi:glutathione S-transferase
MKLFYGAGSPYARIVRIALIELDLDARTEKQEVTLRDPDSALLPYNPVGRVPTLQLDDGTVLTETLLILSYLDTRHDGRPLLPRDGSDGWATLARLGTVMGLMDGIAVWNRELRRPEHERSPGMQALELTRATRTLDVLERAVAGGAYAGWLDAPRIALGSTIGWTERRHRTFKWREGHPVLSAWYDDIAKTPSFEATLPPIV